MDRFDSIPYEELSAETTWTTLGKGSFGSVFCGNYLGLEIAIKEINPSQEYDGKSNSSNSEMQYPDFLRI